MTTPIRPEDAQGGSALTQLVSRQNRQSKFSQFGRLVEPAAPPTALQTAVATPPGEFEQQTNFGPDPTQTDVNTALARNAQFNLRKLLELRSQTGLSSQQIERIDTLIEMLNDEGFVRNVSEDRVFGSNFVRGIATGAVNFGVLGTADLAATIAQLGLPKFVEGFVGLDGLRTNIREAQQIVTEGLDPEGISGATGNVLGTIGGGILPFGASGRVAATTFKALLPGTKAAQAIATVQGGGGTFLQRFGTNVLFGVPIDALAAYGIPEATTNEKLLNFAIFTGLSVAGAGLIESPAGQSVIAKVFRNPKIAEQVAAKEGRTVVNGDAPLTSAERAHLETIADQNINAFEYSQLRTRTRQSKATRWTKMDPGERMNVIKDLVEDPDSLADFASRKWKDLDDELKEAIVDAEIGTGTPAAQMRQEAIEHATDNTDIDMATMSDAEVSNLTGATPAKVTAARTVSDTQQPVNVFNDTWLDLVSGSKRAALRVSSFVTKNVEIPTFLEDSAVYDGFVNLQKLRGDLDRAVIDVSTSGRSGTPEADKILGDIFQQIDNQTSKLSFMFPRRELDLWISRNNILNNSAAQNDGFVFDALNVWSKHMGSALEIETVDYTSFRKAIGDLILTPENGIPDVLALSPDTLRGGRLGKMVDDLLGLVKDGEINTPEFKSVLKEFDDTLAQMKSVVNERTTPNELRLVEREGTDTSLAELSIAELDDLADLVGRVKNPNLEDLANDLADIGEAKAVVTVLEELTGNPIGKPKVIPQELPVDPATARGASAIEFDDIPTDKLRQMEQLLRQGERAGDLKPNEVGAADKISKVLAQRGKERNASLKQATDIATEMGPEGFSTTTPAGIAKAKEVYGKPLEELTFSEFSVLTSDALSQIARHPEKTLLHTRATAKLDEILEFLSRIRRNGKTLEEFLGPRGDAGFILPELNMSLVTGSVGFFYGLTQGDTPQERLGNALMAGLGFGLGAKYLARRLRPGTAADKLPIWQKNIRNKIVSVEDDPGKIGLGPMQRIHQLYTDIARVSFPVEKATKALGGAELSFQRNPGKMAEVMGLWRRQADSFFFDRPSLMDAQGNRQALDAVSAQDIAAMVDGDTATLGEFLAAARTIEQAGKGKSTGIDLQDARLMWINSPRKFHEAQKEVVKYYRALADVMVESGVISRDTRASFEQDIFYAPLNKVFKSAAQKAEATLVTKGSLRSAASIINPAEAMINNTPRVLRSAELNRIKSSFVDLIEESVNKGNKQIADQFGVKLSAGDPDAALTPQQVASTKRLQDEMSKLGHDMTEAEAQRIALTMSDDTFRETDSVIRVFRNGNLETWRVHSEIAKSMHSLSTNEMDMLWRVIGFPAQVARVGITAGPRFILWQAFRDNFQFFLNAEFGMFVPFVDQMRGWWNIVGKSKEFRNFVAGGGSGDSIADQGLATLRSKKATLREVQAGRATNDLERLVQEVSTLDIRQAYATLVAPIADAARVGTFLRGRGRGMSVAEAVYKSKRIGANFTQRGRSATMRGISLSTLFLNASIQSVDESARSFARNPIAYLTKAFAGISVPSLYFWAQAESDNDIEIQDLRTTEGGRRYWFTRDLQGAIVKIPKPIFDGALWGSSVEAALDRWKNNDPTAVRNFMRTLIDDAAVNLLPTIGVVPASLASGFDLGLGSDIIPQGRENLDIEFQSRRDNSTISRIISNKAAPLVRQLNQVAEIPVLNTVATPAGFEFLVRNFGGELSLDVIKGISLAIDYVSQPGFSVDRHDLPLFKSIFPRTPSLSSQPVREFYDGARRAEQVANTLNERVRRDPASVPAYVNENIATIQLTKFYSEIRADLADLSAGVKDIEAAPPDLMTRTEKREITDALVRQMIEIARSANSVTRSINSSTQTTQ